MMLDKNTIDCPKCSEKVCIPTKENVTFICPSCHEQLMFGELEFNGTSSKSKKQFIANIIINFITWILAIPIFIFVHKYLPDPEWFLNLDRIIIAICILIILKMLLKTFKALVVVSFIIAIAWLSYGSFFDGVYGFGKLYRDYKAMLYTAANSPQPVNISASGLKPFRNRIPIEQAINYDNPEVRNYALSLTKDFHKYSTEYFDYHTTIQCFAIFKEIRNKWNYVNDPKSREYFAKASESLHHLSGDCDDYAILIAACIKATGGVPRLVRTKGHLYPELLIGTKEDLDAINFLIRTKLFEKESAGQDLHYHIGEDDKVWLNMDYTAKYPGGKFMSEEVLEILTLDE